MSATLQILNASAGAGKTFSLVKLFLTICLQTKHTEQQQPYWEEDGFKKILAITFTNKAAQEMKDRILEALEEMVKDPSNSDMGRLLMADLKMPSEVLSERAHLLLRHILHEYATLSVSTIDHFNHRLIRTFGPDLALSATFDLELDQNKIFANVADLLIDQLGNDDYLTNTVVSFVEEQLSEGKSWNMQTQLKTAAQLMLEEDSLEPVNSLKNIPVDQLKELRIQLLNDLKQLVTKGKQLGAAGSAAIAGIPEKSFPYGNNGGIPSFFKKWERGEFSFGGRISTMLESGKWTKKNDPHSSSIESIIPQLEACVNACATFVEKSLPEILLKKLILKDFHSLSLLQKLEEVYNNYKESENILPIGEFNKIINEEISNQSTPYIYERIGERYTHFFIDEFQDTSKLQWLNLAPLVNHSVGSGGSALLVGDPKQSIYRWRGGDTQQFISLANQEDPINKIELNGVIREKYPIKTSPILDNWRSKQEIVMFNNQLYERMANLLNDPDKKAIYLQGKQLPKKAKGGYVHVEFLEAKDKTTAREVGMEQTYVTICNLIAKGHEFREITLLVRNNSEGRALVMDFAKRTPAIPVISSESLALSQAIHTSFIVHFMGLMLNPSDGNLRYEVVEYLFDQGYIPHTGVNEIHQIHQLIQKCSHQELWKNIAKWLPGFSIRMARAQHLVDLMEYLMRLLDIANAPDAFLQRLLDLAQDILQSRDPSLANFLEEWNNGAKDKSVSPPENMNAVKVTTIHKAKGLQFPIVILPFADWSTGAKNDSKIWVPLQEGPLQYARLPINSRDAPAIGGAFEALVTVEKDNIRFDNLNLLYVATTRAISQLYIFSIRAPSENQISSMLDYSLQGFEGYNIEQPFTYGEAELPEKAKEKELPFAASMPIITTQWDTALYLSKQAPESWSKPTSDARKRGKLLHALLEDCPSASHIERVLNAYQFAGKFFEEERQQLKEQLLSVLQHPELSSYFEKAQRSLSERAILLPSGEIRRPDRVLYGDFGTIVIDFKTGAKESKHIKQLEEYLQLLQQTGAQAVRGRLVYIQEPIEIVNVTI